jgi:ATP-dependent DNA helicase RecQ
LYVSPERLVGDGSEPFRRWLLQVGVRFVAVDEAHCISQWGHDFRPEYRLLGRLRTDFSGASFHAFTATATARVQHDIGVQLGLRDPLILVGPFDRPNLTYRVRPRLELRQQLESVLARHQGDAGIIYCLSRREVDELAQWLQASGARAVAYHAGLSDEERRRNQDAFLDERADVVVATVAFGMGIDRPDVRFVVHAGSPRSLEHYQQEAGRAGRDGLAAECVLFTSAGDGARWRSLLESNGELSDANRQHLRDMERYASATSCRHRALVEYFGQRYDRSSCGACDWCLGELEAIDDSVMVARKVLSCVVRTGQRFGAAHVTSVLTGQPSEAVRARGHHELSTYGLLAGWPVPEVRGYLDQLAQGGFLARAEAPYPTLQLTREGHLLLKGEASCVLYRQPRRRPRERSRRMAAVADRPPLSPNGERVLSALRSLRLAIARERHVPAYVVFHDTTLHALADRRPATLDELLDIPGLGRRKVDTFGRSILDTITAAARDDA